MKAVSLFSGCGGFCEGVELAGFEVAVAVELDPHACITYRANFPKTPLFEGDIAHFATKDSGHIKRYHLTDVDLVFGGPPCQGFSQIGPRNLRDGRNELYLEFARILRTLRPRMFLMENVPNLLLMNKGHFREAILRDLAGCGYSNVTFLKVSAADFGVPQTRERVFFFGTRDDLKLDGDLRAFAEKTLKRLRVRQAVTVRDAICDLPAAVTDSGKTTEYPNLPANAHRFLKMMRLDVSSDPYSRHGKLQRAVSKTAEIKLHNHHTKEMQEKRAKLISYLRPGAKADSLPKEIWNGARPEKWRRLHPDLPSYTILAQMHRDLSEWVHPWLERWITVREAARLQSFHDGFVFKSSEWQQLKQIGNAVPPLLAFAAAKMAVTVLSQLEAPRRAEALTDFVSDEAVMASRPKETRAKIESVLRLIG